MSASSKYSDPDHHTQQHLLTLFNEGKYVQALTFSRTLLNNFSKSPLIHNVQGAIYQALGQFEQAIKSFSVAVEIRPDYAECFFNLGNAQRESGRLSDALTSYKKTISLDVSHFQAHTNLGVVHSILGDTETACRCYRSALAISPHYTIAHNNLGSELMESEQMNLAIHSFERAIASNPNYIDAIYNLGIAKQEIGQNKDAVLCFEKVILLDPNHLIATIKLGNLYFEYKRFDYARKLFILAAQHPERDRKDVFSYAELVGKALECLIQSGKIDRFNQELKSVAQAKDTNIRIASLSAYASQTFSQRDIYPFCRTPLQYISYGRLEDYEPNASSFIKAIIKEMDTFDVSWEPKGKSTRKGFQTEGSLFTSSSGLISRLEDIIGHELAKFYSKFKHEDCNLIHLWPKQKKLEGWYVRMGMEGFQDYHIHPSGWVSGVIYLKTVAAPKGNEGALKLSCVEGLVEPQHSSAHDNETSNGLVFQPNDGDMIIFPSSIPHRTFPVIQHTDRCVISFDLAHPMS